MNGQLFDDAVDVKFVPTNMAIYWFTATSTSPVRFYYENAHTDASTEPTIVPFGLVSLVGDFRSIRWIVDRDHKNVVSWHEDVTGGSYAAHQASDVLSADLRGFFNDLLADRVGVWVDPGAAWFWHMATRTTPRAAWVGGVDVGVVVRMTCRIDPILTCDLIVHVLWPMPSGCVLVWFGRVLRSLLCGQSLCDWSGLREAAVVDRPVGDEEEWRCAA